MIQVQGFGGTGPCSCFQAWFTTRKAASTTILVRFWWTVTPDFGFMADRFPLAMEVPARSAHSMMDPRVKTSGSFSTRLLVYMRNDFSIPLT